MLSSSTILVVDDMEAARVPIVKLLNSQGYHAVGASDGQEAWDAMPTHTPGLILLDILMPVMNGLEFLGLLRSDERWCDVPVVVLTAVDDKAWERDIRALGVQGFLRKAGFSMDDLDRMVREFLPQPS